MRPRTLGIGVTKLRELDIPSYPIGDRRLWKRSELDAFVAALERQQFAPEGSDTDLAYFAQVARRPRRGSLGRTHLPDPLLRRRDKDPPPPADGGGPAIHRPAIGTPARGIVGPEWCGRRRLDRDGNRLPLEWLEVWDEDEAPYAARCLVIVDGWDRPANGTAKWSNSPSGQRAAMAPRAWFGCGGGCLLHAGQVCRIPGAAAGLLRGAGGDRYLGDDDAATVREVAAEAVAIEEVSSSAPPQPPPAPRARGIATACRTGCATRIPKRGDSGNEAAALHFPGPPPRPGRGTALPYAHRHSMRMREARWPR